MAEYIERETIKAAMIHYGFKSPDMTVTEFVEDELPDADVAPVRMEAMTMEELKPCPFCGGKALLLLRSDRPAAELLS